MGALPVSRSTGVVLLVIVLVIAVALVVLYSLGMLGNAPVA
jgi:cytochrome c-type biogenesis protein CcmH/NrfG